MILFLQARRSVFSARICSPCLLVDAHVGKALFEDAIIESLRNQGITVILVTHALHFLSQCDYIYTLKDGRVVEHGTHKELVANAGEFARLDKAYGGAEAEAEALGDVMEDAAEGVMAETSPAQVITIETVKRKLANNKVERKKATGTGKIEGRLIVCLSFSQRVNWSDILFSDQRKAQHGICIMAK